MAARRTRERKAAKAATARTLAEEDRRDARQNALVVCYLLPLMLWLCAARAGVRFENVAANNVFIVLVLILPTVGLFLPGFLPPTRLRFGFVVVATPFAAIALLVSLFVLSPLSGGLGGSETLIRSVRVGDAWVRAYRVDRFLDDSDVYVQWERAILPGLVWVTPLDNQRPANAAMLQPVDARHVRCTYPPYLNDAKTRAARVVRCDGWF